MYKITYIHKEGITEYDLYIPASEEYSLTSAELSLEMGKTGELRIGVPDDNKAKSDIVCLTDEIIVYRDENELFRGRAVTKQSDFYLTGTLTVEGVLAYLFDTYYPPFDFSGAPNDLLNDVIENHNNFVDDIKKFQIGQVTVSDPNNYIARSSEGYNRTLDILSDKFVGDSLGGYFRVRVENRIKYVDYLSSYGTTASQKAELGSNILDIAVEVEYSDLITAVLPIGEKTTITDDSGNQISSYVTIESVNNGDLYFRDADLIEKYGFICECVEWSDVTEPQNLKTKAAAYLAQKSIAIESITVRVVDLSFADDAEPFELGDIVPVKSEPHGIDQMLELSAMKLDLLNPANDTLTFGTTGTSLTSKSASANRNIEESINNLTMIVGRISSDYITTKTLVAEIAKLGYVTAEEIDAEYAKIADLETEYLKATVADIKYATIEQADILEANIKNVAGDVADYKLVIADQFISYDADIANLKVKDAEIENALIAKASVIDLDAVSTRTGLLEANYSELETLVNGNLTSANIQSLTLTAQNTVIENGMIKNAMIESVAADKITAGTIYTNLVRIYGDENKLLSIVDNTIQISDENEVVRVQIGEDASGDYNMYLWDAAGNLLWNATGVTESGLNDGIIKDVAVAADANISGSKLDIESVITEVNGATTKLKSTTIMLDESGQTLDVAFNTMTTTIVNNLAEAKSYADGKAETALSDAKSYADSTAGTTLTSAQQYALNQANSVLTSAKSYADSVVDGIEIGGRNLLLSTKTFASPWGLVESTKTEDTDGFYYILLRNTFANYAYQFIDIELGTYTASFYAKAESTVTLECKDDSLNNYPLFTVPIDSDVWKKYVKTFKVTKNTTTPKVSFLTRQDNTPVYIKKIKIEKGNKATDWTPAPEDVESEITNLTEITTTQSTQISTMQGQITALITEDTNIKGDYNALVSRYNSTVADVESMKTTIGEHTTLIDANADDITTVSSRVTTVETDLNGIKTRVSATETAITKKADGTTVDALTSRVAVAESTLDGFETSLTTIRKTVSDNYTELYNAIDGIEIGGRNYALNSNEEKSNTRVSSNASCACYISDAFRSLQDVTEYTLSVDLKGENMSSDFAVDIYLRSTAPATTPYLFGWMPDSEYKRFSATVSLKDGFSIGDIKTVYVRIYSGTGTLYVKNIKVEIGNKATDWTPAPEDVESEIATVSSGLTQAQKDIIANAGLIAENVTSIQTHEETLSNHDTRITAAEEAISLKVSTVELESYKTTVTGQISTAKGEAISTAASDATTKANNAKSAAISAAATDATTKANNALASAKSYTDAEITVVNESLTTTNQEITVMKGQIELKVEQTDIETAIASVEIGGRNLALGSGVEYSNTSYPTHRYSMTEDLVKGETYTWTIWGELASDRSYYGIWLSGGNNQAGGAPKLISEGVWQRTYTHVLDTGRYTLYVYPYPNNGSGSTSTIHRVKFEKGTKATDWTPAPEDVDASITAVNNKFASYSTTTQMNSAIELAKDEINLSVSQTYATIDNVSGIETRLSTAESNITAHAAEIALSVKEADVTGDYLIGKINLSSTTATIAASHINLAGAVTVSMLATDTKTQIDTAATNASTALTNAANAQNTADTAVTNAAAAQTTANTANTNASTALTYAQYHYGTCATAAATKAKVVILSGFKLYTGATVSVKFTYANTVTSPTLNVNSTGAKSIYVYGAALTASSVYNWVAGSTVTFVYNGTQWVMTDTSANKAIANWCYNNNLTYINGGAIYAKSITAAQIDVDDLFAQEITATNLYITGNSVFEGELNAATGTFAGTVYATNVNFDGFNTHLKSDNDLVIASGGRDSSDGEIIIDQFQANRENYETAVCIIGPTISVADDINFVARHAGDNISSGQAAVGFGVGTGGYNRGVYDFETESWMLCADQNNKIYLGSIKLSEADTSGVFHRYGKVVEVRYYGTTVSARGNCPSGYRPSSTVSIAGWLIYNSIGYPAYISITSAGVISVKYVSISTGTGAFADPNTASAMYFNGCYIVA